jgi:hypothetical protein
MGGVNNPAAGVQLIRDYVADGLTAGFNFTAIPQNFRHLQVLFQGRGLSAALNTNLFCTLNGDVGANYMFQRLQALSTGVTSTDFVTSTEMSATIVANTAPANVADMVEMVFAGYRTPWQKTALFRGGMRTTDATGGMNFRQYIWYWRNVAAINALNIFTSPGNLAAGSVISLYGLP